MPWCDSCAKFWNPNSLTQTGDCPSCGRQLRGDRSSGVDGDEVAVDDYKAPWHFKLMVGLAVAYVTWRIIQMATWFV